VGTRLVAAAVAICLATPALANPPHELGDYERAALATALAKLELTLDPEPAGKRVRAIHVVNLDVFGEEEGAFLRWFNIFHRTTREDVIEREVLLRPGQVWDEEVIEDNRRRMNDQLFTNLVVFAPIATGEEGTVDLLVVTRDIWSLRMNSNIEIQEGKITELLLSISENNLLGWRKQLALVFDMDLGSYSLGPLYVDKNVAGTRLQFSSRLRALFSRETSDFEGTASNTNFVYPLWSLKRKWGASLSFAHFDGVQRAFFGVDVAQFPLDAMPGDETIDQVWDRRIAEVDAAVTRSFGYRVIQRVSLGYELRWDESSLPDDVAASPALIQRFENEVLPRSELTSALTSAYSLFTPRYTRYRNIDTYDLPEDATLGPSVAAALDYALEALGSDATFLQPGLSAGYTGDLAGEGFVRVAAGAATRIQDGDFIDNTVSASVRLVTPPAFNAFRVIAVTSASARFEEQANRRFVLGGANGLRGYPINFFSTRQGDDNHRSLRANVEVRSLPLRILFSRAGVLAFWDAGGLSSSYRDLPLYHDVGIGLRLLLPQLQPYVFRLDWAIPLNGPLSGVENSRIIFGSRQAF
jgi:hypothetical protein